jgi:peptidoglycan-N-acetylglucosamine deacetylase
VSSLTGRSAAAGTGSPETLADEQRRIEIMIGLVTAALAGGAATFAGAHTMIPWSQLYGENFTGIEEGRKALALTFDDGPNDPWTMRLLEVLAKHQARATFFMVGRYVRQRPGLARAVVEAGHAAGNHAYSHSNLIFAGRARLRQELEETSKAMEEATGERPFLFRPPFGGRRPGTFQVARELKMLPVMWRVTCYDWSAKSPEQILKHARRQISGGEVVLLHDGGHLGMGEDRGATVRATDELIAQYKDRGFAFLTVPEMMQLRPGLQIPFGAGRNVSS